MPVFIRWLLALGPLNPIAVRLGANGSRRMRHMTIRAAYLAVLVVVLLWALILNTSSSELGYRELAAAGARAFIWIAYLQIGLICVLAPVFMAGAIAQEANPQTWDVLLTTPLSAPQIVLGNLLGRLFFILALVAAGLPLFALTQYFGGVPGRSVFTSCLIASTAALLVGTIAIALSVSRLVGKRAVFAFYVSVVTYLAITWAIDAWMRSAGLGSRGGNGVTLMTAINPFLALHAQLNPSSYPAGETGQAWLLRRPVAAWCVLSTALSIGLLGLSTFTVRTGGLGRKSAGIPWYRRIFGLAAAGAEHRSPRNVWTNPISWREAAARNATLGRIAARWTFIGLGGLWALGLIVVYHAGTLSTADFQFIVLATVWAEIAITTLVAINMSATSITREREDGTLDLLLTTPLSPAQYLSGKLRGLVAYLLPMLAVPIGTLLLAGLYVALGGFGREGGVTASVRLSQGVVEYPAILPEAGLVAALGVVPFVAFASMVGLDWSVKSKGTLSAVGGAIAVVGVGAGIVGLCGWKSGLELPILGPALAALSPASLVFAVVHAPIGLEQTADDSGLLTARIALLTGSGLSLVLYAVVVYGLIARLVRPVGQGGLTNFDMIVRRLAGTR